MWPQERLPLCLKFEVLRAINVKIMVFEDVTPCSLADREQEVTMKMKGSLKCLHLPTTWINTPYEISITYHLTFLLLNLWWWRSPIRSGKD
jgi:hypothetical protein